jgi:hypothetical protein
VSGAAERSIPVIATLAYATTTLPASAITQVAAVSRRRLLSPSIGAAFRRLREPVVDFGWALERFGECGCRLR